MGPGQVRPALAGFRDEVTALTVEGYALGDIEEAINAQSALTEDQKSALWLFAFSLRDRSEKRRQARALLAVAVEVTGAERDPSRPVERLGGTPRATNPARPREFDPRGFPVPQDNRSFLERVARLLNPE
jgi:hypothetical protein